MDINNVFIRFKGPSFLTIAYSDIAVYQTYIVMYIPCYLWCSNLENECYALENECYALEKRTKPMMIYERVIFYYNVIIFMY